MLVLQKHDKIWSELHLRLLCSELDWWHLQRLIGLDGVHQWHYEYGGGGLECCLEISDGLDKSCGFAMSQKSLQMISSCLDNHLSAVAQMETI